MRVIFSISEKVKNKIEESFNSELLYCKKNYNFTINLIGDSNLVIPEYKIELINKNKKIIKKIENIQKLELVEKNNAWNSKKFKKINFKNKTKKPFKKSKNFIKNKKINPKKTPGKTLWVNKNLV